MPPWKKQSSWDILGSTRLFSEKLLLSIAIVLSIWRKNEYYNELLCQHKKIHRFKVYKSYSLFVFQFIALEGFIHFIRHAVI